MANDGMMNSDMQNLSQDGVQYWESSMPERTVKNVSNSAQVREDSSSVVQDLLDDTRRIIEDGMAMIKQGYATEIAGERLSIAPKVGSGYVVEAKFPEQGLRVGAGYIRVPTGSPFKEVKYPTKGIGITVKATGNFSELPQTDARISADDEPKRMYTEAEKQELNDKVNFLRGLSNGQNVAQKTLAEEQSQDRNKSGTAQSSENGYVLFDRSINESTKTTSQNNINNLNQLIKNLKLERNG